MRIGIGYDVHRLAEGRELIMGGVRIPYEKGLLGHSDADVLLHAVMDALLGAAALGDIGKHFPDTDPAYRGISSLKLLEHVGSLLEENCFLVENIDAVIIAQAPKMGPYMELMRENIGRALGIGKMQINVKATTEEGLGFTGSGEGISAQAVCLLTSPVNLYAEDVTEQKQCGDCCGCPIRSREKKDVKKG
ncbi:MAG: 2-C-methyl-D-erythritol 2,4-cyclodiphosphate synthase [Lachnospiraceae bacterium]|nr:2-C-methyl-D-erythritol 2,4-cyclodiphosphate synthase [Lachnospiraceae bacterium]